MVVVGTSCHPGAMTGTGVLWIVGTPIGNLGDLSPRALEVLGSVDLVACEDTRRTGRLLAASGVQVPMRSFFEGNETERLPELLDRLRAGGSLALVTDGGMPSVSDPGYRLVAACADEGIDVRVVPGPSAAIAALVVSGLPTDRFAFEGFLPRKAGDRARRLEAVRDDPRTLVVFESPRRVAVLLREVARTLGDRRVAVARELTKLHEEVLRGSASELAAVLAERAPKGEVVVVIEGKRASGSPDLTESVGEARELVASGMRPRDAAKAVSTRRGVGANDLYRALLEDRPTP
jgi:16S rRNA (cytidine1402-2'-O)-methyltransferase